MEHNAFLSVLQPLNSKCAYIYTIQLGTTDVLIQFIYVTDLPEFLIHLRKKGQYETVCLITSSINLYQAITFFFE